MKKLYLFCLLLIMNTSFLFAQNGLIKEVKLTVDSTQKRAQTTIQFLSYNGTVNSKPFEVDKWHYVVWSKATDKTGKLYVDGNLLTQDTYANYAYSWSEIYLGASYVTAFHDFFKGWLDEVRVSNIVRTQAEITNNFNAQTPFAIDANTVSLWRFNETSGTSFANSVNGTNLGKLYGNATFTTGKFGNALYFNGISSYGDCNFNIPENDVTIEFWVKADGYYKNTNNWGGTIIQPYGMYSGNICLTPDSVRIEPNKYQWSTGNIGYSTIIEPTKTTSVSVTNSIKSDTINLACFNKFAVTDTLIIHANITSVKPLKYDTSIKIYPNPTKDKITIDFGDYSKLSGYQLNIVNATSQTVYSTQITQVSNQIDLSSLTGKGLYFVHLIDKNGKTIDVKKLILE